MKYVICAVVLLFAASGQSADFDYPNQDSWGEHYPDCADSPSAKQSPVNLFTGIEGEAIATNHATLVVDVSSTASGVFKNNGHTLELAFDGEDEVGTLTTPGAKRLWAKDVSFTLDQLHFHSPSEHVVNGKRYDLEQHMVFSSPGGRLAVVGTFYTSENDQDNNALAVLFAGVPVVGQERVIEAIDLTSMLPASDAWFFHYRGSTTTPPCVPNVEWNVYRDPLDLSVAQLARFNKFYRGNYRDLQRLNGRFSTLNGPSPFSAPFPELDVTYEYPI